MTEGTGIIRQISDWFNAIVTIITWNISNTNVDNDREDRYNSSDLRLVLCYCHNNNLEYKQ